MIPDPNCGLCNGTGAVEDPNGTPGGFGNSELKQAWMPCPACNQPQPTGSLLPRGGVFHRVAIGLLLFFILVPTGIILLLQTDWAQDLMSTSTEERIAEIMESQTVWIGEADCNDSTRPVIIESKMVPAIGEFLGIVLLKPGADAHQALLTAADEAEARPADAPAGLALPQDLPRQHIAAATSLLGGGDETQASFSRKKDDKVTGPQRGLAPRSAEVTFDKSDGTITGTRCSTFTGTQPD